MGHGTYRIEVAQTAPEFRDLAAGWERLDAETGCRNPFLSYRWTEACVEHLLGGRGLFCLTARAGERLVGVAPLCLERRLGFRVLRFAADGRSDYLGFLCSPEHPGVEPALLEGLAARRAEWDVAILRQLAEPYSGLSAAPLPGLLRDHGIDGTVAPYLAFDGDWESLCKTGPYWLREMKKSMRRFEREGGVVERFTGAAAAERMDQVAWVEAHSWKGRQGVTRLQPGPGASLLRQALTAMEECGMELWLGRLQDTPVAFQIAFRSPRRIGLYNCAYHEEYRRYSAGALVIYHAIREAWTAGAREYDFMSGDEAYKRERTNAVRTIRYRALYPLTPRGALAYGLLVAPRWRLKRHALAQDLYQRWVRRRGGRPGPAPRGDGPDQTVSGQALSGRGGHPAWSPTE